MNIWRRWEVDFIIDKYINSPLKYKEVRKEKVKSVEKVSNLEKIEIGILILKNTYLPK